ncbi:hypothetical protein GQ607_001678 [Colletotrichum asianum]|uniref:Uncharacterized protein n=1 Tax=Colletotrichum asianum TaxID=702518 RepID=A0A8H3WNV8_9PEZI|nr:hypothetical protein GQ607_001678 [Colletotrichum asianum]
MRPDETSSSQKSPNHRWPEKTLDIHAPRRKVSADLPSCRAITSKIIQTLEISDSVFSWSCQRTNERTNQSQIDDEKGGGGGKGACSGGSQAVARNTRTRRIEDDNLHPSSQPRSSLTLASSLAPETRAKERHLLPRAR